MVCNSPRLTPGLIRLMSRAAWGSFSPATIRPLPEPTMAPRISIRPTFSWSTTATRFRSSQLPFGKGRQYAANMNPVVDAFVGGWELTSINTAHTGTPLDVTYGATGANIVSSLSNDYRGQPFLRPNVSGSAVSQSRSAM